MRTSNSNLERLELILGYSFNSSELLRQSLSHRSYSETNNERLEFLGDSIINFFMGEALYHKYPDEDEGTLSRLRSYLVKKQSLYEVGVDLQLSDFILLGQGELSSGGHTRQSLIADCVEAVIAAVFLDSQSMEQCRDCVTRWFAEKIESINNLEHLKDPKTRLQECMQSKHEPLPSYTTVKVEGAGHDLIFHVSCRSSLFSESVDGSGSSRRKAEQNAAYNALIKLNNTLKDCNC